MALRVLPFLATFVALLSTGIKAEDDDDSEWADTPMLTSLFQATSSNDNDGIDRLLDTSEKAASARSSDGRGLLWWAWEFKNTYVLASIMAAGGDVESTSEDASGKPAMSMCTDSADCDKATLLEKAKGMVDDIKKRKEQRKAEREKEDSMDDDDEELADDEF
eukprot:TRINITY_DN300_c0_g1_i2.p1 TRINITY_DN300_c0_g1~~TRINITY_DN300_c0_g1_i2.p1  ORF type:complete len:183 (-),score=53.66 TRINITY_DN300_c0_g1_i2:42-530(-)